ncbi:hypothetical protein [Candidatus Poriferisodalis sp.]|uniref:hypothetical protein n=1 Tax=Candidatus Poriferisodalis sp. TaxID=3101277 RepID=UPI003B022741
MLEDSLVKRRLRRLQPASSGLASLEWLLVTAAVAGFAAVLGVAIQQILEDSRETRVDSDVRWLEAGIAAAEISSEAASMLDRSGAQPDAQSFPGLRVRCEELARLYADAVAKSAWVQVPVDVHEPTPTTAAVTTTSTPPAGLNDEPDAESEATLPDGTATTATPEPQRLLWVCQLTSR